MEKALDRLILVTGNVAEVGSVEFQVQLVLVVDPWTRGNALPAELEISDEPVLQMFDALFYHKFQLVFRFFLEACHSDYIQGFARKRGLVNRYHILADQNTSHDLLFDIRDF